ncbi:MAG: hypothetical protein ACOCXU_07285, partial [Coleofasciculus sp.]
LSSLSCPHPQVKNLHLSVSPISPSPHLPLFQKVDLFFMTGVFLRHPGSQIIRLGGRSIGRGV